MLHEGSRSTLRDGTLVWSLYREDSSSSSWSTGESGWAAERNQQTTTGDADRLVAGLDAPGLAFACCVHDAVAGGCGMHAVEQVGVGFGGGRVFGRVGERQLSELCVGVERKRLRRRRSERSDRRLGRERCDGHVGRVFSEIFFQRGHFELGYLQGHHHVSKYVSLVII